MPRSTPIRVFTEPCVATSCGVPLRSTPPSPTYGPSVFSRITMKSCGVVVTGAVPTNGRWLTYRSSSKRIFSSRPRSITPGGTSGVPTAPSRIAS